MALKRQDRIGGCFAPSISEEKLAHYASLVMETDPNTRVGEALRSVLNCVQRWWELPESTNGKTGVHPTHKATFVPLDDVIAKELWEHIPWTEDLNSYGVLFEELKGELRNTAFHLLWYAKELDLDREPITNDRL